MLFRGTRAWFVVACGVGMAVAAINCGSSVELVGSGADAATSSGTTSSSTTATSTGVGGAAVSVSVGTTSTSSSTGGGSVPGDNHPPDPPPNAGPGDGPGYVYAVDKLYLGDTDWNGSKSQTAWQLYGYDLDGKNSNVNSIDHCKPYMGATPKAVKQDGPGGLDNSFGKNIVPIITSLTANASATIDDNIAKGGFTMMFKIDKLGAKPDYAVLAAAYYGGAKMATPPPAGSWANYKWDVMPELLNDPQDITSSKVKFPSSYLTSDQWVSGAPTTLTVTVPMGGYSITYTMNRAVFTLKLAPDRQTGQGILAGILPVEPFIAELKKVAGSFSKDLCMGSTFDSIAVQLRQTADIGADGSQDPSKTCDGISLGWGLHTKAVQLGNVAPATPPAPDPCK